MQRKQIETKTDTRKMKNLNRIVSTVVLVSILLFACKKEKIVVSSHDHRNFMVDTLTGAKGAVYFFLAPECPLSENYTLTINQLQSQFVDSGMRFYAVVSGKLYDSVAIKDYANRFPLTLPLLVDTGYYFSNIFKATITPEVFLLNEKSELVYQGAIDDWATDLTQLKAAATKNYLLDAMNAMLNRKPITIKKTNAVGCYIEK